MVDKPAPLWTVTGQQQDFGQNDEGHFVQGVTVRFRARSGGLGQVFIPVSEYTVETATRKISEMATTMETIHGLTGQG